MENVTWKKFFRGQLQNQVTVAKKISLFNLSKYNTASIITTSSTKKKDEFMENDFFKTIKPNRETSCYYGYWRYFLQLWHSFDVEDSCI